MIKGPMELEVMFPELIIVRNYSCHQLMTLDCVLTDHLLGLVTGPVALLVLKKCAVDLGDNQTLL